MDTIQTLRRHYKIYNRFSCTKLHILHPTGIVYHTIHYVISDETIRRGENGEKDDNSGYLKIDSETMELLENIQQAMGQEKNSTHVITGLLTMLVIILTTFVLYLCFSRGISSMSKYVM